MSCCSSVHRILEKFNVSVWVNGPLSLQSNVDRYLKVVFTDRGVRAAQSYPVIGAYFAKKARKKPKAVARAIVAQQLARSAYHMLTGKVSFQSFEGVEVIKEKKYQWPHLASPELLSGPREVGSK